MCRSVKGDAVGAKRVGFFAVLVSVAALLSGCVQFDVQKLASDAYDGRDNNTAGSVRAQNLLIGYLRNWTAAANTSATGDNAYKQPFDLGTNIIGVLPGTDLADEYVMVGAHYDHLGHSCRDLRVGDDICNGATDNATSVAAVLQVLRTFASAPDPPRRSIIFAFWDREEDGLLGSQYYTQHPLVPLADTVAYVNLDIQGSDVRPSLRNTSFAIGAETGGTRFEQLVQDAIGGGTLGTRQLSVAFGQGRSDHRSLIAVNVPSVFFSDATGPCYHTDSDDVAVVDFQKLDRQIGVVSRLTSALASTDSPPTFTATSSSANYDDAVALLAVIDALQADLATFTPDQQTQLVGFRGQLQQIVAAGPASFTSQSASTLLSIAATSVAYFTTGPCSGFLAPSS
jgi:Zn-dependent M28 family amino/carboxypeptidase